MSHPQVAVLGGGITGLCAAHLATQRLGPDAVVLLEQSGAPGGYAKTEAADGCLFDQGPNGFLDKEPLMLQWVEALGLNDEIVQANEAAARRFIIRAGELVEIVPPPKFFLSPILSPAGKARLICEPFIRRKRDDNPETIWEFAARRIGHEAADTLVSAMVAGVFGGNAQKLSLAHCFPRMQAMEKDHGGLFRAMLAKKKSGAGGSPMGPGGTLTTFRSGIGQLAQRATEVLGDQIQTNFEVASIVKKNDAYKITSTNGREIESNAIINALPAPQSSEALKTLAPDLSEALANLEHASIVVVCTAYHRDQVGHDMNGFGFLAPRTEPLRVLGCIWTSSVFPHTAPKDHILLRTMIGGYEDPDAVKLRDENLLSCVAHEVNPLLHIEGAPVSSRIYRHRRGIPQYMIGHENLLQAADAAQDALPGFAVAGNAYRGVSLNDCVVSAHRAVDKILQEIEAKAPTA